MLQYYFLSKNFLPGKIEIKSYVVEWSLIPIEQATRMENQIETLLDHQQQPLYLLIKD